MARAGGRVEAVRVAVVPAEVILARAPVREEMARPALLKLEVEDLKAAAREAGASRTRILSSRMMISHFSCLHQLRSAAQGKLFHDGAVGERFLALKGTPPKRLTCRYSATRVVDVTSRRDYCISSLTRLYRLVLKASSCRNYRF